MRSVSGYEELRIRGHRNLGEGQIASIGQVPGIQWPGGNLNAGKLDVIYKRLHIVLGEGELGSCQNIHVLGNDTIIKSHLQIGRHHQVEHPARGSEGSQEARHQNVGVKDDEQGGLSLTHRSGSLDLALDLIRRHAIEAALPGRGSNLADREERPHLACDTEE